MGSQSGVFHAFRNEVDCHWHCHTWDAGKNPFLWFGSHPVILLIANNELHRTHLSERALLIRLVFHSRSSSPDVEARIVNETRTSCEWTATFSWPFRRLFNDFSVKYQWTRRCDTDRWFRFNFCEIQWNIHKTDYEFHFSLDRLNTEHNTIRSIHTNPIELHAECPAVDIPTTSLLPSIPIWEGKNPNQWF